MNCLRTRGFRDARILGIAACAMLGMLALAGPSRADIVLNIQSVAVAPNSTGNAFDVTLTNTGPAINLAGFGFTVNVPGALITLTGASINTVTATYAFNGHSAFGPNIETTPPGQTLDASDVYSPFGSAFTVAQGATVGLGRVSFNVGNTSGPFIVSFDTTKTSLSSLTSDIPITTFGTGTITVGSAAIPEPSTLATTSLALVGALGLGWYRGRRR